MARLWSSGAELNSTTANVEFTGVDNNGGAVISVNSVTIRSGTYAVKTINTGASGHANLKYNTQGVTGINKHYYARAYIRVVDLAAGTQQIMEFSDSDATRAKIQITTGAVLQLIDDGGSQVGSNSSALNLNQWYMVELKCDMTTTGGSVIAEAQLDGSSFASGTYTASAGVNQLDVGPKNNSTSFEYYFDDIAINDSSGSFQNSWPGEGEIIHLRPNASGDNSGWTGSNTDVDEVTPDDATSYLQTTGGGGALEDVNIDATPAAMDSDDTINVVQVGARFAAAGSVNADPFKIRIKAAASGTVEESAQIQPNSTTYVTNAKSVPRDYALTLYNLPGASTTDWTKSDLDTTQIGVNMVSLGSTFTRVSTLWLLVDHKPAAAVGGTTLPNGFMTTNTGFWGAA